LIWLSRNILISKPVVAEYPSGFGEIEMGTSLNAPSDAHKIERYKPKSSGNTFYKLCTSVVSKYVAENCSRDEWAMVLTMVLLFYGCHKILWNLYGPLCGMGARPAPMERRLGEARETKHEGKKQALVWETEMRLKTQHTRLYTMRNDDGPHVSGGWGG
jgi:hypothetical protein